MSLYAQIDNGEVFRYPLTIHDIQSFHSNTSFVEGMILLPEGFVEVVRHDVPERTWYQRYHETNPVLIEDQWHQNFEITDMSQEEQDQHIATLKTLKNSEINASRLEANYSAFEYNGKLIAVDQLSRSDIDGTNGIILSTGELPQPWPGGWKATDNTWLPITTVQEWKTFYGAMYQKGVINFVKAQTLKAALYQETCDTPEKIEAIKWSEDN